MDHFHGTGGTERHLTYLVGQLPREQFRCRIVVLDLAPNRWVDAIRAAGIPVIHVPVTREYAPGALPRALELSKIIRANETDIVQTFHQKSDTYGAVIARLSGVRHIVSSKRDAGALKKPRHYFLNRRLRGLFEKVIVVADSIGDVVVTGEQVPRSKIVRIYNGVDTSAFAPPTPQQRTQARERLGFTGDDFVVGMVARFRPEKSYDVFFEGAFAAAREIPRLRILAMGGGPLLEHFRNRYVRECAELRVQIINDVTDVAGYLHAMDLGCLLPAGNEGFSNSVLEKMAVGLPMIVTDVGGNAEAVIDGLTGLVVPPRDPSALGAAILKLALDGDLRRTMGDAGRERVEKYFSIDRCVANYARLYAGLSKGKCPADIAGLDA